METTGNIVDFFGRHSCHGNGDRAAFHVSRILPSTYFEKEDPALYLLFLECRGVFLIPV